MLLNEQTLTIDHFKQLMEQSAHDISKSYVIALHDHKNFKHLKYPYALMIEHYDDKSRGLMVDDINLTKGTVEISIINIRHTEEQKMWLNKQLTTISGNLFPTLFSEFR